MEPFKLRDEISYLYNKTKFDIEMHTHNDFGMATANDIAGVMGGANYVGVTVNGLGERAGNAALEEVLMALIYVYGYKTDIDTRKFKEVSEYVSRASGRFLPKWKAIVGENTFVHESGIHADGAIKNPMNYEAYDPAVVGLERQIVIGKHSGKAAIVNKFKEYDIKLSDDEAKDIMNEFETLTEQLKLLEKIDTANVEEMVYPFEDETSFLREDVVSNVISQQDALANVKNSTEGHFVVPKVVK